MVSLWPNPRCSGGGRTGTLLLDEERADKEKANRDGTINRSSGDSVLLVQAELARHNSPRTTIEPRVCVLDNTLRQVC